MTLLRRFHAHALLAPLALLLLAAVCPVQAQDGTLDPSFGTGGLVTSSAAEGANATVIDTADRIVVVGGLGGNFSVARFTPAGALDPTFGTGGFVTTDFGGSDVANAVALQPDGKIVVAGTSSGNFAVARYTADGVLDATFGTGGLVTTDFGGTEFANAVAIQPDGRIVAAGWNLLAGTSNFPENFALAGYTPDGVLDPTFGSGGLVTTDFGGRYDRAHAMAIYPDGRIIVVGESFSAFGGNSSDYALARYTAGGTLDPTFGSGGLVTRDGLGGGADAARAVALDSAQRIIIAGDTFEIAIDYFLFIAARFTPSGALDTTFGFGGFAEAYFNSEVQFATAVAVQTDDKVIAAGRANGNFVMARFDSDGEADETFGVFGEIETNFGGDDGANAMGLDSAGRIVVAGASSGNVAVARYLSAPPPPPVACEPGSYSATGNAPCLPAPPGTFVATASATEATPCAVGSFQPDEGQIACLLAPPGQYVDLVGAVAAIDCAVGSYSAVAGAAACTLAEIGFYVDVTAATAPIACPVGTFQPDAGQTNCLIAPPGTFVATTAASAASDCALGTYQPDAGQTNCLLAEIGFYVDVTAATAATACPTGQITAAEGSTSIDDCDDPNQPPMITAVLVPPAPTAVLVNVAVSAPFTDPDAGDTHTCSVDYGDGSAAEGTVDGLTCIGTHAYAEAGIYTVIVTVTDAAGESDMETATDYIVVYDPTAGFVTGGGWIISPEGAYPADPTLTGRASFGFVSKYKKGRSTPDGNTQFQFNAAGLSFHSTAYDWLVIAGTRAKFKGVGTIDGAGDFGFMLTAADTDPDLFRIMIWDRADGDAVVYDNQMGEDDDSNAGTELGGGQIMIHSTGGSSATGGTSASKGTEDAAPMAFALAAAYPNPFNPTTEITFALPEAAVVRVVVYDVLGREVARLVDGAVEAGVHRVRFEAGGLPSGTYLYRLEAGRYSQTRRMVLLK